MDNAYDDDTSDKHALPPLLCDITRILLAEHFSVDDAPQTAWSVYDALTNEHQNRIDKREAERAFIRDWVDALGEDQYRKEKAELKAKQDAEPKEPYTKELQDFAKAWNYGNDVHYVLRNGYCRRTGIEANQAFEKLHDFCLRKKMIQAGPQPEHKEGRSERLSRNG